MHEVPQDAELVTLLTKFSESGGVLDYVFLEPGNVAEPQSHKAAALAGIAAIDRRLECRAISHASEEYPAERFFRLEWDESKLAGKPVSFASFWGTDDVRPKPMSRRAWSIPEVDGYKPAFFHPPYGLRGSDPEIEGLFEGINAFVLGSDPAACEILAWSTDWSNYFDAGKEWWGAFYWTVRPTGSNVIVVIGASSTD
jgi:hypothetical protein